MIKMKLLITDKVDEKELLPLAKYFSIDKKIGISQAELAKWIKHYEAIITRSSTAVGKIIIGKAKKLKIIGRAGIGVDNIDIFAATENNIAVLNAPLGNSRVTAEHTIGLLFSLLRHIPQASAELKKGVWAKQKYTGYQILGKTLGIVGFGNVGRKVCEIASAVGLSVLVCEPYITLPKNVHKVTFEELLSQSDIITFHVPATYLTRKMLNRHTLSLCKKGVYIINCSRGAVVDETAILEGLRAGKIAGFAVDVFTKEPEVNLHLLSLPNVIATPHIAGSTYESQKQSLQEIVKGILEYIKGTPPSNLLNPQVFQKKKTQVVQSLGFDAIIFDCDSTLSKIEGIVELSRLVGKEKKIAAMTQKVLEGTLPFESVFEKRLELIRPTRKHLEIVGKRYIKTLVEDAKEVIEALTHIGKRVYIVSGGYTQALLTLGNHLGIPHGNIFGNDLLFDAKGGYIGSIGGPLRRNWGKLQILRSIPGRKLMVGDSITDLETKECVDLFVGYGGVGRITQVEEEGHLYLYCESLSPIAVIASGVEGCMQLLSTKYRRFVGKGLDLLSNSNHVRKHTSMMQQLSDYKTFAHY